MRISPLRLLRALSRQRAAWLLGGVTAVAAPFACSESSSEQSLFSATPGRASAGISTSTDARARLQAIAARFPSALQPTGGQPLRFEASAGGGLRPILAQRAGTKGATVELPVRASEPARIVDEASQLSVSFTLEGAAPAEVATADGIAVYPGAAPGGGDILHRVSPTGTEDFILFSAEPEKKALRYQVDVSAVAGLRLVANTLEFLDPSGTPCLRVAPPYILGADGERRDASLAVEGCAVDRSPKAPWGRPVVSPGSPSCTLKITLPSAGVRYPALVDPVWGTTVNTMSTPRTRHTSTVLNSADPKGLSLIAGGFDKAGGKPLKTAELYDPLSRRFSATGTLNVARGAHTATPLAKIAAPGDVDPSPVLLAGGADASGNPLGSLEVYDPASGVFVPDSHTMPSPRFDHTATLFADNKVLLAGGISLPLNQPTNTAHVYTFTSFVAGSPAPTSVTSALVDTANLMTTSRTAFASVRLGTGDVLLTGGFVLAGGALQALQTAELWSPSSLSFGPIQTAGKGLANMTIVRGSHTATLLNSGKVLIVGGSSKTVGGSFTNTIDLYSDGSGGQDKGFLPQSNPPVTMQTGRANHTATPLPNGDVLIAGGFSGVSAIAAEEVFSLQTTSLSPLSVLAPMTPRGDHTAIAISAGDALSAGKTVLVMGGSTSSTTGASALATAQILLRVNGEGCSQDNECLSGHCADVSNLANPNAGKMCCDSACNETCKSCSNAGKGSGADGVCGFASGTTELGWTCVSTEGQEVEILQGCDGNGHVIPFASNRCTPKRCNGDRCAITCPCSDAGFCTDAGLDADAKDDAGDGGDAGLTDDSGLHCEDRKPTGLACVEGRECNSGFCVDGYCCNVACTGQCEACDVPGKIGFCTAVGKEGLEAPHVDGGSVDHGGTLTSRKLCDGADGGCSGACDGVKTQACAYPGGEKVAKDSSCSMNAQGFATTAYSCDSKGGLVSTPSSCNGFKCASETACKTSCATDDDCIADYVCRSSDAGQSTCQKLTGPLCDGKFTLRKPIAEGGNAPCADHYTCPADATECRTDCDSVNDCVDGYVCNAARKCVKPLEAPPVASCSCRAVGDSGAPASPSPAAPSTLALLALGAAARRRQRA